jgi:hypothetical protein
MSTTMIVTLPIVGDVLYEALENCEIRKQRKGKQLILAVTDFSQPFKVKPRCSPSLIMTYKLSQSLLPIEVR